MTDIVVNTLKNFFFDAGHENILYFQRLMGYDGHMNERTIKPWR